MSATDYTSSDAYVGVWTNWSRGKIHGATLTLPRREAGLLTAFLAIYVSAVGGQFWRIVCYMFHQARAGQTARQRDGFHRQIQVLLRNSEGAGGGLWEFARLPFQWRHWGTSTLLKCTLFAFLAFLNLSAFGAASIFSSAVAKAAGNETLIHSKNCGFAVFPDTLDPTFSKLLRVMRLSQSAAGYARACYGDVDNLLQCTTYPQRQIKYETLRNVSCPFESHRCLDNLAVAFDTGELDTFKVFGINSAPKDRLTYRRITTCAPIYLDDIRKVETVGNKSLGTTEEVENIYAGPTRSGYSPLNTSAPTFSRSRRSPPTGLGYTFEFVAQTDTEDETNQALGLHLPPPEGRGLPGPRSRASIEQTPMSQSSLSRSTTSSLLGPTTIQFSQRTSIRPARSVYLSGNRIKMCRRWLAPNRINGAIPTLLTALHPDVQNSRHRSFSGKTTGWKTFNCYRKPR